MFIVAFNVAKVIEFRSLSRRCWSYDAFKDVLCGFVRAGRTKKNFFLHLLQASEERDRDKAWMAFSFCNMHAL